MSNYPNLSEWLNLVARWAHVFAAILWVGSTYFFTWLDGRLTEEERTERPGEKPQVWMVHSGGFYVVEKQKVAELSRKLHWFRYEALFTWLTGMFLLVLVYYLGGALTDPDSPGLKLPVLGVVWRGVGTGAGTLIGLGLLAVSWVVYDLLVRSPLGKNELLFALVSFVLIVAVTYALTRVLSGRAAYIHVGAMFGTIMVSNVWMRILPAQRRMIAAMREGKEPDATLGAQAKARSKHNTFMVVPAIFTMISNHFPVATYGHDYNWLILSALVLAGWAAAYFVRRACD